MAKRTHFHGKLCAALGDNFTHTERMFHVADYVLFVLMLVCTVAIGGYYAFISRKKTTTLEYLTGGRNLNVVAVSMSLLVSFVSPSTVIGVPAEVYTQGGQLWLNLIGDILGTALAAIIFVPVYYPLKLTSVNQYLRRRFDSRLVTILGTLSNAFKMIFLAGLVSSAAATSMETMTGFPTWAAILCGNLLAIIYTTIGGFKAVIWTDVFQTLILLAGLLALTIQAVVKIGSMSLMMETSGKWDRLDFLNFSPDPRVRYTFWSMSIGACIGSLSVSGNTQAAVQRYSSVSSLTKARMTLFLTLPWDIVFSCLSCLSGLAIFSYYTLAGCDPLSAKLVSNPNQLVPYFVLEVLSYPGLPGLFLAALFAASLSTASSALNATAANIWDDVLREIWPNLTEKKSLTITKLLVVASGIVATGVAYLVNNVGGTIIQVSGTFLSSMGGPFMGMYILGLAFPFANWIGAATGALFGTSITLWMGLGSYSIKTHKNYLATTTANCSSQSSGAWMQGNLNMTTQSMYGMSSLWSTDSVFDLTTVEADSPLSGTNPLEAFYSVSFLWIALIGLILSLIVGVLVSLVTGSNRGSVVDPIYLHPWIRRCARQRMDVANSKDEKTMSSFDNPAYMKNEVLNHTKL